MGTNPTATGVHQGERKPRALPSPVESPAVVHRIAVEKPWCWHTGAAPAPHGAPRLFPGAPHKDAEAPTWCSLQLQELGSQFPSAARFKYTYVTLNSLAQTHRRLCNM